MNFNYSYRAFLITSLLFGILFLGMYSIKLSRYTEEAQEQYDVEYALEELDPEETNLATIATEKVTIETNRAYNEAEKFISELEENRDEPEETTEEKLQAMNEAIDNAGATYGLEREKAKEKIKEAQEKIVSSNKQLDKITASKAKSRKTTISYSLVDRKALYLPNPVYTCEGSGKVVITIEVNNLGKVVKTAYNKSASTTANECLIDSALEYAKEARFTTDPGNTQQLGTISYNFPGQQ
ncbi:hypothetical protein ATE92_0814 [Ulvibacter sp. MAR_2010_11]|uniref:hypothetical protein n=1 Tax=Ulvibacter sp. MAR_2010_11 TaxID=1250229 RepID=UPI000C2B8542|nr:hypothetical protein [Ulvibacter sp. MAR_2010_11]PKA82678.1 hypothetical protein ATE92_0814 [Ulvibacter sp. MAR_2010_11]